MANYCVTIHDDNVIKYMLTIGNFIGNFTTNKDTFKTKNNQWIKWNVYWSTVWVAVKKILVAAFLILLHSINNVRWDTTENPSETHSDSSMTYHPSHPMQLSNTLSSGHLPHEDEEWIGCPSHYNCEMCNRTFGTKLQWSSLEMKHIYAVKHATM
jgi:hypothetical protein